METWDLNILGLSVLSNAVSKYMCFVLFRIYMKGTTGDHFVKDYNKCEVHTKRNILWILKTTPLLYILSM